MKNATEIKECINKEIKTYENTKRIFTSELWIIYCKLWTLLKNKDVVYSGARFYKVMKIACEVYELMEEESK